MRFFKKDINGNDNFIKTEDKPMLDWSTKGPDGCIVSDMITKVGWKVGYMYRDKPSEKYPDSGWRFFKGDESETYANNIENCHAFELNTICNYDPDIIPYLDYPVGSYLMRVSEDKFEEDDDDAKPIYMTKQKDNETGCLRL